MTQTRHFLRLRTVLPGAALSLCISIALAATPTEQQAIVQTGTGGPEVLKLQTVPVLEPAANEVLIRVYAAAVNPADTKSRTGTSSSRPAPGATLPSIIAGGDVAGVVEKLGSGVTGLKAGDPVFAIVTHPPGRLNGAYAQFAVASIAAVVPKPRNITFSQAAGLGIAGVTGVRTVVATRVAQGQRVLITGVAGGVGSTAAQAAKARGAYVIGTASAQHNAYLRSIGVDEVIDYTRGKFEEQVRDVDAVIDTVGADTAERAMTSLRKGGMYISVGGHDLDAKCVEAGVICVKGGSAISNDRSVFEEVASLAASGKLKVKIDRSYPLANAAQAQSYSELGHTEGKIVLIVDAAKANTK
jgi:NADPH:quinone reductase-like Zn-dependent oxidoreductase